MTRFDASLLLIALLAVGCADGKSAAPAPTVPPSVSESASPSAAASSAVPSVAVSASAAVETDFGYITAFITQNGATTIVFDKAELYTGDAAKKEAAKDGQELDSDYYIRNNNPLKRNYLVAASTSVEAIDWDHCCDVHPSNVAGLKASMKRRGNDPLPVHIKHVGTSLLDVEEQYFP